VTDKANSDLASLPESSMAAKKLIRDRLEERVLAGDVRTEADPARLSALLDARLDEDLAELRAAEHPEAADYATLVELLLARAARQGISQEQIEAARLARAAVAGRVRKRAGLDASRSGVLDRPRGSAQAAVHWGKPQEQPRYLPGHLYNRDEIALRAIGGGEPDYRESDRLL
jgi:predicted house-cleaning noncanonical NTP pyrophosphatase (MazG superfamily)